MKRIGRINGSEAKQSGFVVPAYIAIRDCFASLATTRRYLPLRYVPYPGSIKALPQRGFGDCGDREMADEPVARLLIPLSPESPNLL